MPKSDSIFEDFAALAETQHHFTLAWSHHPIWTKEAVTRSQYGVQHGLVQQCIPHPLGYNDVYMNNTVGKGYFFNFALNDTASCIPDEFV